ncbi:hypothetical protein K0M31_009577 [Melipona bicolor]|uniref:Uncharacterized protein n=1 Tax=Melipona bicolor TaxID=60889 RepID=A0AA40FP01_9HYME|nr:hypothetical protein K0M31_009577 [Melipona bicolor]
MSRMSIKRGIGNLNDNSTYACIFERRISALVFCDIRANCVAKTLVTSSFLMLQRRESRRIRLKISFLFFLLVLTCNFQIRFFILLNVYHLFELYSPSGMLERTKEILFFFGARASFRNRKIVVKFKSTINRKS